MKKTFLQKSMLRVGACTLALLLLATPVKTLWATENTSSDTPRLSNLALNRPTTASAYEESTGSVPANAVDGNMHTRFAAGRMKNDGAGTAEATQTSQWLQIDLGKPANISSIEIDFHLKVYATDYKVLTSATGDEQGVWEEVHRSTALAPNNDLRNPRDTITFQSPQSVRRYLRFKFDRVNHFAGGNAVSIKELRIQGHLVEEPNATTPEETLANPSNLVLGRPALASGVEANTNTRPENAFDEDANTRWASPDMKQGNNANQNQTAQWLQVDLGAPSKLSSIEVDFYRKVYATDYTISSSDTAQGPWEPVISRTELVASNDRMDPQDRISFARLQNVKRHLRFDFRKVNHFAAGNGVSVKTIRVIGERLSEVRDPIDPVSKIAQAQLEIQGDRVVLTGVQEDEEYTYEIIGSANPQLVAKDGTLSPYRLNEKQVTLLVAARQKTGERAIVPLSKRTLSLSVPARHQETVNGNNLKPRIALEIQEFLGADGFTRLAEGEKVYAESRHQKQVDLFNQDLQDILGFTLANGTREEAKVLFHLTETDTYYLKEEGYLLKVGDKIEVFAHNPKAFNHAAVTLAQLLQKNGQIPKGIYRDYPLYSIRGMVIDVARIPMRMDFLKKIAKLFRWYKLNELHLHLNDTQWPAQGRSRSDLEAWKVTEAAHRLQSTSFPSLNQMPFKHDRYEGEYNFYREVYQNPRYSLEEFRSFQTESNDAGVSLLAEIDTPGHSAIYSVYAMTNPDNIDYLGSPIHHPSDLEALSINENAYPENTRRAKQFVKALLSDYLDHQVFTYDHIHLGVDEYWQKQGNLEAFRQYLNEMNQFAKEKGKTVRTWGALSVFTGNTPVDKNIIFDEWAQHESVTIHRIDEGYQVVNVPQPFTYITPGRNHKDIINEQYVWDHWTPNVFNLDRGNARERKALEGEPLLLGAKGAMWGDEHAEGIEESDLYERLEKSLAMIGFKTWNAQTARSYLEYQKDFEETKLGKNYTSLSSKGDVLVHLQAKHSNATGMIDLSTNQHPVRFEGAVEVVDKEGEKWLKFDGTQHLVTQIDNIPLPYTLEMTFQPTAVDVGSLFHSQDGAIFLNGKGRKQSGEVREGLTLNRYFYAQHIAPRLEANRTYKLTLSATRQVLNVYLDNQKIATFAHQNEKSHASSASNFRTSFRLPFREIAKGFKGYIKELKVYNRTSSEEEISLENLPKRNLALHQAVYDFRHNSLFQNQNIRPYHRMKVTDGDVDAGEGRWSSSDRNNDYFIIDLGKNQSFSEIQILFDSTRRATAFKVYLSENMHDFREIHHQPNNTENDVRISFDAQTARYVKFENLQALSGNEQVSVKEMRVFQTIATTEKEALAQAFARKKVLPEQAQWLLVNNVVNNKFASDSQVSEASALLPQLEDAEDESVNEALEEAKTEARQALEDAYARKTEEVAASALTTEEKEEKTNALNRLVESINQGIRAGESVDAVQTLIEAELEKVETFVVGESAEKADARALVEETYNSKLEEINNANLTESEKQEKRLALGNVKDQALQSVNNATNRASVASATETGMQAIQNFEVGSRPTENPPSDNNGGTGNTDGGTSGTPSDSNGTGNTDGGTSGTPSDNNSGTGNNTGGTTDNNTGTVEQPNTPTDTTPVAPTETTKVFVAERGRVRSETALPNHDLHIEQSNVGAQPNREVYDIYFTEKGNPTNRVTVPTGNYEVRLRRRTVGEVSGVVHLDNSGNVVEHFANYRTEGEFVVFNTTHFSLYAIEYASAKPSITLPDFVYKAWNYVTTGTTEPVKDKVPNTSASSALVGLWVLVGAGLLAMKKRK